tara:strand:+ start:23219 stop:23611 length:393 start_codon:yes stop_codon:yes gene_type:complete
MLKKFDYLAFEPQFLCEICAEAVTTPLCPVCLTKEIDAWTTLYPNLRKELLPKLKEYLEHIKENITESTACIKCKNKRASVCPYCFTDHVLGQLKKISSNSQITKEFLDFFDFDTEPPDPHKAKWGKYPD